jgi:hypothetical protein
LGGGKERRTSRDKAESMCSDLTHRSEVPSQIQTQRIGAIQYQMNSQLHTQNMPQNSEPIFRKLGLLEGRVKELHVEKQQLAVNFNEKLRSLEAENERLKMENDRLSSLVQ